ncbi:hypothetical protein ONE63_006396 [Megalurothrips usitatus]|uniref:28S ribosomal protein S18a, mitochondrial n=1 Tax=Megalurothrips usitatus TaxID=439358 RepID=A0AAV7XVT7_9NEOP|nr:hypothetical protein ONE63_006396 [Megalurothrips usitatus]
MNSRQLNLNESETHLHGKHGKQPITFTLVSAPSSYFLNFWSVDSCQKKMLRALNLLRSVGTPVNSFSRTFGVSPWRSLKEIRERQDGDTLIIEAVHVKSPREGHVVKSDNQHGACSLCALGLDVKHTDILIIKQFMDSEAKLYPRKITGLCRWQQRKMRYVIEMAIRAGLVNPLVASQPIPAYQRGWRKFNTYFDESEIPPSKSEYAIQKVKEFEEAYQLAKAEKDAHEEMLKTQRERRLSRS